MIIYQCVSTVATSKGLEDGLLIYSPGHMPIQNLQDSSTSMVDRGRDMYLLSTTEQQNIIYVAIIDYMIENCRTWGPEIRYIQDVTDSSS